MLLPGESAAYDRAPLHWQSNRFGGPKVARASALLLAGWFVLAVTQPAECQTIYPIKDGTLADGGAYGPFDGVADDWDYTFNQTSYEGSITLTTDPQNPSLEHRVFWEYNLATVYYTPPVSARLTFTVRGAPIWPFPDVDVHIYSYPSDFQETPDDFNAGPVELQGVVTLAPYQPPTEFVLDVSSVVNQALISGENRVAFRFQVDPNTSNDRNQAFIDALDSDPSTKPYLVISEGVPTPGDIDGDGDVDLADLSLLLAAYNTCTGDANFNPAADLDGDGCVDLADLSILLSNYGTG